MKNTLLNRLIEPKQQISEDRKRFSNAELRSLIFPIIVEQFLALLVGIADTLMVSHVGEAAVSGVSLINQLNNVFIMVFTALASGGAVVASQYIGSRDTEKGTLAASQRELASPCRRTANVDHRRYACDIRELRGTE